MYDTIFGKAFIPRELQLGYIIPILCIAASHEHVEIVKFFLENFITNDAVGEYKTKEAIKSALIQGEEKSEKQRYIDVIMALLNHGSFDGRDKVNMVMKIVKKNDCFEFGGMVIKLMIVTKLEKNLCS